MQSGQLCIARNLKNYRNEMQTQAIVTITAIDADGVIHSVTGCGDKLDGHAADFAPMFRNLINYKYSDIDIERANRAHYGLSMLPERRGYLHIDDYVQQMAQLDEYFSQFVTEENRAELVAALEAYRVKYLAMLDAYLSAMGRVMSTMIAGPARFPSRQNEKRSNSCDKRRDEFLTWQKQAQARLEQQFNPRQKATRAISSDDENAVDLLQKKVANLEEVQARMKAVNKIVRGKGTKEEKIVKLQTVPGVNEQAARSLMEPDCFGGLGFASFSLTNNNANIRRLKIRLAELERQQAQPTAEQEIGAVRIVDNAEENRVQIHFPERLPRDLYQFVRHQGFVWSPTNQAFQRKRNESALHAARLCAQQYQQQQQAQQ